MNHLLKRTLQGALLVSGLWVIGQGLASADTVTAPANAPVIACGNSVGLFSSPAAGCPSGTGTTGTSSASGASAGDVSAPSTTPVSVTGNSIGIGQPADSTTSGSSTTGSARPDPAPRIQHHRIQPVQRCERPGHRPGDRVREQRRGVQQPVRELPVQQWDGQQRHRQRDGHVGYRNARDRIARHTGLFSNDGLVGDTGSAQAPVTAPATVCGNSVGIGADPSSGCPTGSRRRHDVIDVVDLVRFGHRRRRSPHR